MSRRIVSRATPSFARIGRSQFRVLELIGAAGAFVVLAGPGTLSARILIVVSTAALLLRSRLFVTVRQRVPLVVGGLVGTSALGVDVLRHCSVFHGKPSSSYSALECGNRALA